MANNNKAEFIRQTRIEAKIIFCCRINLTKARWNYQPGVDDEFGLTIFLGLLFILDKFANFNNPDLKIQEVRGLIQKFEKLELSTIEETLRVQKQEHSSDDDDASSQSSAAELIDNNVTLTGPFSGTGSHIPGLFSFGKCVNHSAPQ